MKSEAEICAPQIKIEMYVLKLKHVKLEFH